MPCQEGLVTLGLGGGPGGVLGRGQDAGVPCAAQLEGAPAAWAAFSTRSEDSSGQGPVPPWVPTELKQGGTREQLPLPSLSGLRSMIKSTEAAEPPGAQMPLPEHRSHCPGGGCSQEPSEAPQPSSASARTGLPRGNVPLAMPAS